MCLGTNRHTQGLALDLQHKAAHKIACTLTKTADVVGNFRPIVSDRLQSATSRYQSATHAWFMARFRAMALPAQWRRGQQPPPTLGERIEASLHTLSYTAEQVAELQCAKAI
jgi:crotonobetainyl-CoA:carnitine CoA-transferase CaiB-like acyl-CoA transferase